MVFSSLHKIIFNINQCELVSIIKPKERRKRVKSPVVLRFHGLESKSNMHVLHITYMTNLCPQCITKPLFFKGTLAKASTGKLS